MKSSRFDILCVEPTKLYSMTLKKDLQREEVMMSSFTHTSSLAESVSHINNMRPHLVFLSLNFQQKELREFLKMYPPQKRTFALIFVEAPLEQVHNVRPTLRQQIQRVNFTAQHQAGYLYVGAFGNEVLVETVHTAREWLQNRIATIQKEGLAQIMTEFLSHPYIVAHQRILREQEILPSHQSAMSFLNNDLRYFINYDEERRIPLDRIVRVEGDNKYCRVWYFEEQGILANLYLVKRTILEQLSENVFVQTHRSHWVNLAYIRSFTNETVILLTGDAIPCSRRERLRVEGILQTTTPQLFSVLLLHNSLSANNVEEYSAPLDYMPEVFPKAA